MTEVNQAVRGWGHYLHCGNSTAVFSKVRGHVSQRVRNHLVRRYKLTWAQAYRQIPDRLLYQRYGLYKLPTHAAWRSAHALV